MRLYNSFLFSVLVCQEGGREEGGLLKWEVSYNQGQNICRLFNVLVQFPFTTSELKLDYYHQEVNVRVDSRVTKQLRILRNLDYS